MSLRLAIPWRVGLHQSPPPLRQLRTILMKKRLFDKENPLNSKCANSFCLNRGVHPKQLCQNCAKTLSVEGVQVGCQARSRFSKLWETLENRATVWSRWN